MSRGVAEQYTVNRRAVWTWLLGATGLLAASLAARLIMHFPQHYPMFSETEFTWDGITQKNRNPLLYVGVGADGLKTGHTSEAGYGLVGSAIRDGRRILLVVNGLDSASQRSQEAERLINWAFRAFETRHLFAAGHPVAEADVWVGAEDRVTLAPARDVIITAPYGMLDNAGVTAHFPQPVEAPVEAGTEIGRLEVSVPGVTPISVPLVAAHAGERGGVTARLKAAASLLMRRVLSAGEG